MSRVFFELMRDNPAASYEHHKDAENAVLHDPDLFVYGPEMLFKHNKKLVAVKNFEDKTRNVIGLGLAKDSEFTLCFNHHLTRMKESGVIWTLLEKSHLTTKQDEDHEDQQESEVLGYETLRLPMIIIGAGCCSSIFMVLMEKAKVVTKFNLM